MHAQGVLFDEEVWSSRVALRKVSGSYNGDGRDQVLIRSYLTTTIQ